MDDEANNPDTGDEVAEAKTAESAEDHSPDESSQLPEDTAETAEIQGKESSEIGEADAGQAPVSEPKAVAKVELKTLRDALDFRHKRIETLMVEKEAQTIMFAQTGKIHAAYNESWREEVRLLFRLQTRLEARKASLTRQQLEQKVVVASEYAYGPDDLDARRAKGILPINKKETSIPSTKGAPEAAVEAPFEAAQAELDNQKASENSVNAAQEAPDSAPNDEEIRESTDKEAS